MRFSGLMTITWGENISECLPSMPEKKKEKCTATLLFHPQKAKTDPKKQVNTQFCQGLYTEIQLQQEKTAFQTSSCHWSVKTGG